MSKKVNVTILLSVLINILSFIKSAHCQTDVKLIAGFEREEAKSWDSLSTYLILEELSADSFNISEGSIDFLCTKGYPTQGWFSLTKEIDQAEYDFCKKMWDPDREPDGWYGDREWYIEKECYIIRAFRWFRDVFEKDWSSWDLIWMDVLSTDANAIIRVIIEDRWEASAIRRFEIPAGKVSTIKFTLRDVATIGEIDLTDMNNLWITFEETNGPTIIYIDNIRLATLNAQKNDGIPFVTDDTPVKKRTIPEVPIEPVKKDTVTKDQTPIGQPLVPIAITFLAHSVSYAYLGGTDFWQGGNHYRAISAFDNQRFLIILNGKYNNQEGIYAIASLDGGLTWTGIDSTIEPVLIGGGRNSRSHCAFEDSEQGNGFLVSLDYCYGPGGFTNVLFRKITFTGYQWNLGPEIICYNYVRHCPVQFSGISLLNRTLWISFDNWSNISSAIEVHAFFSSNEGEKWGKLSKSPLVSPKGNPFLSSYQNSVACINKSGWNELSWSYCTEGNWVNAGIIERNSSSIEHVSVTTIEQDKIFIDFKAGGKLYATHLENNTWQKDLLDDGSGGKILRSIMTSVGKIPYCIWAREINTDNYGLYYRRYNINQNIWESIVQIMIGETDEIYNLACPNKSPQNFIPLLYDSAPLNNMNSDNFWLKLIKIPVDTMLAPAIPILASPLKGSSHQDSTITLKWHPAADAETYHLQLDKNGSFSSPFVDLQGISDTTSAITHLDPNTTYYWRVRATNGAGDTPWSEIWDFNVTVVPVELASFSANILENAVELNWITVTETNNYGFEVQRGENKSNLTTIGFVKGYGTSLELHKYSFMDISVNNGTYYYRLKQIDFDGGFEYSELIEISVNLPKNYVLEQNYPNPFNASTLIRYQIPGNEPASVRLVIYDINGRIVKKLMNSKQGPGIHEVLWDAMDEDNKELANGIYFIKLKAGDFVLTRKAILLK